MIKFKYYNPNTVVEWPSETEYTKFIEIEFPIGVTYDELFAGFKDFLIGIGYSFPAGSYITLISPEEE